MRLAGIKLTNYRKYGYEEIDLPDGLVGVIGPNGAGKSSLMEAVAWALYGNPAARTCKEEIKRQGSGLSDICQVILDLELNGASYTVVREMRGKGLSSDAAIHANKKAVARGTEASLDYATKLLGMDREAFFTSFFAKQKELNALSDLRPAERRALVIKMLGIDDIDRAIDMIRQDARHLAISIEIYSKTKPDLNLMRSEFDLKKKEKIAAEKKLRKKQRQAKESKKLIDAGREKFETEEKRKEERDCLLKQYELTKQRLQHQKEMLETNGKEREKIEVALENAGIVSAPENGESNLSLQLTRLEKSLAQSEKKLRGIVSEKESARINGAHLAEQKEKLISDRNRVKELGPESKCPTCLRPLGEDFEEIERHFAKEISRLDEDIEKRQAKFKEKRAEEEKARQELENLTHRRDQLIQSKPLLSRLSELEKTITTVESEIASLEKKLVLITQKGKKLEFSQEKYEEAKKNYEEATRHHHELELGVKDIEKELSLIIQAEETLASQIKIAKDKEKEMAEARSRYENLKTLEQIFTDFRTHLIGRIRPTLSEKASDLIEALTDGKYTQMELDEDYEVYLYDNGERFPIDRFSGGEKDLANLCLRLAISLTLTEGGSSGFGFIVLDEIFGSQDILRKSNIMRALANLSSRFRQIFLITHVEDIKDYMEHVILVSEDETGLSHLTLQ